MLYISIVPNSHQN